MKLKQYLLKIIVCMFVVVVLAACSGTENDNGSYVADTPLTAEEHLELGLFRVIPEEMFHEFVARLEALVYEGVIDIPTMRIFINNHTRVSYEMMLAGLTEFDPVEYRERFQALPYLGYVYMLKPVRSGLPELHRLYEVIGITLEERLRIEEIMITIP